MVMHLDGGTRDHFMAMLNREYPEMIEKYEKLYASKYVAKDYDKRVQEVVSLMRARYGIGRLPLDELAAGQALENPCNRSRARNQGIDLDMLVDCVRAVADRAESIQGRYAKRRGETAVGAAAGTALFQNDAQVRGHRLCHD